MEKKHFRRCFTLVEVLIAMGVCVIGICSIMVFFPVGANASRNAAMSNATSLAADQILSFVRTCIESDKGVNGWVAFQYFTGWNPVQPENYTPGEKQTPAPGYRSPENQSSALQNAANAGKLDEVMKKAMETILKNDSVTIEPLKNQVFYIDFATQVPGEDPDEVVSASDYNCYASLWAEPVEASSGVNIPFAARIHLELSWPAEVPYAKRQTREFSMEVFKAY